MSGIRIYFHNSEEPDNYQRDIIPLAEGLEALGIEYYSRADYWNRDPSGLNYLFRGEPAVDPRVCDVIVFPGTWAHWVQPDGTPRQRTFPEWLFEPGRSWKTVCMDYGPGFRTRSWEPEYRGFDLILRAHYNTRCVYPDNMRPWALGLENRSLLYLQEVLPFEQRVREMAVNFLEMHPLREEFLRTTVPELEEFGLVFNHSTDELSQPPEDPYDRLYWEQAAHRHARYYYQRLAGAATSACFAGELIPGRPPDPSPIVSLGAQAPLRRFRHHLWSQWKKEKPRLIQGDSPRFWESLAAGAVAVHVDLERYGLALPVMPENFAHYVGINLDDPDPAIELLTGDRELLQNIAEAGQDWVLNHYAPEAVARRFIDIVKDL